MGCVLAGELHRPDLVLPFRPQALRLLPGAASRRPVLEGCSGSERDGSRGRV
ncbi:hypothetical protein ACFPRL_22750 [Pseudoclavibacter helvolus]